MADAAVPRFDSVCMDCPDPAELAHFYGALLDWPVPEGGEGSEYMTLDPPGGGVVALTFQQVAAHQREVGLGARHLDGQEKFRVYPDPVGHLFCLCQW